MKFNYETGKGIKMSSKKKKTGAKSKSAEAAVFNEARSIGQNSGKIDNDSQGYSSSSVLEMAPFAERDRFPDGSWPKDGYGKAANLGGPQAHFNNFIPRFSGVGHYARNNEDGEPIHMMRSEHYPGYDRGKGGFISNQTIGRHGPELHLGMLPPRPGFAGAAGPGLTHGYGGTNPPSSYMPHGQQASGIQQTYSSATPMLTQLLRYPNPSDKFQPGQVDEYRGSGPPKNWMENMTPGINQNIYPPRPTMPFYDQRPMMNQTHSNQISVIPVQASSHGSQGQLPSGSGPPGNSGAFAPPPYVQCNPPVPAAYRLEANDRCPPPQHQQRSSSQSRPMSSTSSSLGSPNHIRPISPVPTAALSAQSHQPEKKSGAAQKTSSGSKPKKCKDEVNNIQDISSCDEGGSDSSSSTEVYSQITPMSTPSTTPLPPQSGGTKPSPPGSDESLSNTPVPAVGTVGMALSSGAVPGTLTLGSSNSFTGASSVLGTSQSLESSSYGSHAGGVGAPALSGLKADHLRSTNPCSTYDVVGSKSNSCSQMQVSPMTAFNSQYSSNYGPGNYSRTPGTPQQLYRPQGHPNQYSGPSQMYGSAGPPSMHPNQPCGNYPYPGPSKVSPGQYVQGHPQAVPPAGMHHQMEVENTVSGGIKGYGVPGGMYGPGKMGVQPAPGQMVNANMQSVHCHSTGLGQSNPPHPSQFGKTGYSTPFNAGLGNGVGPPHHQHMVPYPAPPYGGHTPAAHQMHHYSQRPMMSPVPHSTSGSNMADHGSMRPTSPAFYRGGPVGYEPEGPGGPGNGPGRSQWVMNMQGMFGGRVVEAPHGENIPVDMPPVTIPAAGEVQRMRSAPAFEPAMAKDRLSASPMSSSDYTSAEFKSSDLATVAKQIDQPKIENDFSMASSLDSHGQSLMSPGLMPSKSVDLDLVKKDIGSDSNSLPGQDRSRVDSDKQETLSSPPSTPLNHMASSPASLERDISSPCVQSSKSSGNSSVFNKIAEMGSEQDRGIFLERLFSFMSYRGTPVTAVPIICKQTVDLYRLYHLVRERGGMVDVTKNKKWREVSTSLNLGASSSAGFTLKRNYAKFLFPFECRYDRGNIDPGPIILSMEMSSKKETKKNSDRSVDMDNCRPPSNQSYCGYPVGGSLPHGMPTSDIPSCGMHQGMMGQSPSPYNGGMGSGAAVGRSGMMSPVGMSQNHSSLSRGSTESSLASGQDSVSIQDPFHDVPVGPGQYPASHSTMNSQLSMYGGLTEHTPPPPAAGPGSSYEHRSSVPQQSAPSVYNNPANQCISSPVPGSGGQGNNGFGDLCGGSRARPMNEAGFSNHLIHVSEYSGGGSGYGNGVSAQDPNVGCLPPGDRFDGSQSGYPGSMPMAKHSSQAESHITNDQSYYGHYGGQVPGAPSQRYQSGYDPHFFGASNQPAMPGYPGPQKISAPGAESFTQQNHPGEGPMMGHAMGPPHPPVPYQMQKNQAPGVIGGIPKGDVYDYQAAPHVNRPEAVWMQHQFGQHYPPQPYPGSHVMHPNAGPVRGPYGMYSRFPAQGIKKYDVEKQRGAGGPHYLSPNRDVVFPPGSVEATRPKLTKRRKLTHRDMGSVDAWRLMMALRSGLITESTWALDVLTVLLRDDVTAPCLSLSHMPGLLEVLVEQYRRCLILIFGGDFEELEVSSEMQSIYAASVHAVESRDAMDEEETKALPDPKTLAAPGNYTLKTRDGKTIGIESDGDEMLLDRKTWDVFKEFESSAFDWQMGRGDMTLHIITNLLSDRSPDFHKEKYFGMHYERMKKKSNPPQNEEKKNGNESSFGDASISADRVGSRPVSDDSQKIGQNVPLVSKSTEINLSPVVFSNALSSEEGASNMPDSDVLMQESAACDSGEAESKVAMDFDNFDNNQFTCTQLELLKRSCSELDEETYRPNDGVYCRLTDSQLEISQRCLCLSNIFRNLSFISGNDIEICKHNGLMLILGKLLLLNHKHLPRSARRLAAVTSTGDATDPTDPASSPTEAEFLCEEIGDQNKEWWWDTLEGLRENTLVVFANICGQLDLSSFPEEICLPVLNGLLHWLVCSSAEALDSLAASSLSPQRLVLEALCKLCVTDTNIDLVLATPPFSRIVLLITNVARMLSERQQVVREFAVGLLSCLVPGDNSVSRALALHHPSVTLLIEFIEDAELHAAQVVNAHGPAVLRDNPEIMGTSLDMLCRVATILHHLVDVPENVPLISRHQERLLKLMMSPVLDRSVTAILADVLSSCS